jgi:hypothetical protein
MRGVYIPLFSLLSHRNKWIYRRIMYQDRLDFFLLLSIKLKIFTQSLLIFKSSFNYSMNQNPSDDRKVKEELIALLKTKCAILMVGSGSSSKIGYPRWDQLLAKLKKQFHPEYQDPDVTSDFLEYAQMVKNKATDDKREKEYYQVLLETFRPFPPPNEKYTQFHKSLVNLGFCGIVTTNYDKTLEIASQAAFSNPTRCHNCEPLDLCEDKSYSIFPFLRLLNLNNDHSSILHLHGFYQNPDTMILTSEDYRTKYGLLDKDNEDKPIRKPLDTIHRKVIWGLLSFHPLLFVGFSLTDPFFIDMLKTVQSDFELQGATIHFAIMGYSSEEDKLRISNKLKPLGISPVFYKIIIKPDGNQDHNGLDDLIFEFENSLPLSTNLPPKGIHHNQEDEGQILNQPTNFPSPDEMNRITGGY